MDRDPDCERAILSLASAIGRVDPAILGLPVIRLACESCGRLTNRLFSRGHDDPDGACRACARPSPESQLQRFYEETKR